MERRSLPNRRLCTPLLPHRQELVPQHVVLTVNLKSLLSMLQLEFFLRVWFFGAGFSVLLAPNHQSARSSIRCLVFNSHPKRQPRLHLVQDGPSLLHEEGDPNLGSGVRVQGSTSSYGCSWRVRLNPNLGLFERLLRVVGSKYRGPGV